MSAETKILWRANASRSDWSGGEPLRRVLAGAARLGLIGPPSRVEPATKSTRSVLGAAPGDALAEAILAAARRDGRGVALTVGGDDPAPWELYWNLFPFDRESGWVDGLNNLSLWFDRSRVTGPGASAALLEAFFAACAGGGIEHAMIHPARHAALFADEHYEPPVTNSVQFYGVFWANFLGPGHIEEFDLSRLQDLEAREVRWDGAEGLMVVATPDLATADAPEAEPVLLRLNERFRAALRPDARWR
ncbi:MAG TPA: hypothetical protein DD490_29785 [Acidobacteria bacterium]|nr:hypothetical protein [Acidobacteriota bacterium]